MSVGTDIAGGGLQSTFKRLQNGDKSKKDIGAREESRQRVSGAARPLWLGTWNTGEAFFEIQIVSPVSERWARIVEPAATLSPTLATKAHSGPKMISTREPNLM